jgi:hypothetical protein
VKVVRVVSLDFTVTFAERGLNSSTPRSVTTCFPAAPRQVSGDIPWFWPSTATIAEPPETETTNIPVMSTGALGSEPPSCAWLPDEDDFGVAAAGRVEDAAVLRSPVFDELESAGRA